MGAGTHYNRGSNKELFSAIEESTIGTPGSENAKCYGMFHRPDDKKAYHKPTRLIHELKIFFVHNPVLSAIIAHEKLKNLKDKFGSSLFDYRKRGEV